MEAPIELHTPFPKEVMVQKRQDDWGTRVDAFMGDAPGDLDESTEAAETSVLGALVVGKCGGAHVKIRYKRQSLTRSQDGK